MAEEYHGFIPPLPREEASVGQLLVQLDHLKTEIRQEIENVRLEAEKHKGEVLEKLTAIATGLARVTSCVTSSTRTSRSQGSRARSADARKRAVPDADDVPHLHSVADKDRCALPLLRCASMLTVFSLIHAFPSAGSWLSDKSKEHMSGSTALLDGVSGFSLFFFSVAADDSKARFKGKIGTLWSYLCTNVIVVMLMSSRMEIFDFEDPTTGRKSTTGLAAPTWLESFGGVNKATAIVADVVQSLEQNSAVPLARAAKKARAEANTGAGEDDEERGAREQAVRSIRSNLLRIMSDGRYEARKHVFRNFLFLIEKIGTFSTTELARTEGYEVIMGKPTSEDELRIPDNIEGSIWDIPRTDTDGESEQLRVSKNTQLLNELSGDFPSLTVTLRFKKYVNRGSGDSDDGYPEFFIDDLYCKFEEEVSLHRVAVGILVGMFKMRNFLAVMEASGLSLRTIHILAVALRGLLCKTLGHEMSVLEEKALGDVTHKLLEKGDDFVTVMIGNRYEKARDGDEKSWLEKERVNRLEMCWASYKSIKAKRDAEARMHVESARSVGRQQEARRNATETDNFDMSWVEQ